MLRIVTIKVNRWKEMKTEN